MDRTVFKIAHRGNSKGKSSFENHPDYLLGASEHYFVEVDVWFTKGEYSLGHDKPQFKVSPDFLKNEKFFCHAKNIAAFHQMLEDNIHCFWHQEDEVALTSKGYVWKYPEVYWKGELWGVCSDWL